ncbi:CoA transferase [Verticiella sediminum]|uniref:CoA transferase n=1 Tax=Verticiella sediminum TaxID=1247510 RepID=A0A556B1A7_9BURK|nr:CaiB/BaiF CoA-transferase family protein [Verticiella sediminum]TSH98976.1 CoA transferase [Verticiella sediminum]
MKDTPSSADRGEEPGTVALKPLRGMRVVEFHAKGPVPLCTMMLADMGAEVVQVEREVAGKRGDPRWRYTDRAKSALSLNLKQDADRARAQDLIASADVLVEGFRPGAMERLGLGPADCMAVNPRLVYARITGWGQDGPRSQLAGHDINYLAATGALDAIGTADSGPVPPLNLLADFAGGSLQAAYGICAALLERERSGRGCVIDISMAEGVLSLMTSLFAIRARGDWQGGRGGNFLDGGAPWYGVYETRDGRHIAVGAMEPVFREAFFTTIGLPAEFARDSEDPASWPRIREEVAAIVRTRSRDEWTREFAGVDACVTPVSTMDEALSDAAFLARSAFVEETGHDGHLRPAPGLRLRAFTAV